jgi:hypothetical protein
MNKETFISILQRDTEFVTFLKQVQNSSDVQQSEILYEDIHRYSGSPYRSQRINGIIICIAANHLGVPCSKRNPSDIYGSETHLPKWIFPFSAETHYTVLCKNPLYLTSDNHIYLSTMATGMNLDFRAEESNFVKCVAHKKDVYSQTSYGWGSITNNKFEPGLEHHLYLTIEEFRNLVI